MRETYTLNVIRGDRRSSSVSSVADAAGGSATSNKPVDNIGERLPTSYVAAADSAQSTRRPY